jgi:hypothetical protein
MQRRCTLCSNPLDTIPWPSSLDDAQRPLCHRCKCLEPGLSLPASPTTLSRRPTLAPMCLTDIQGRIRTFHFVVSHFDIAKVLYAHEPDQIWPSGYQFQIIGTSADDEFTLLARLLPSMRRMLSQQHIEDEGNGYQFTDDVVRGRIEWDPIAASNAPMMVVDGVALPWEQFGRMLMAFEGAQFRLQMGGPHEDLSI